jgi:hypothetical protein
MRQRYCTKIDRDVFITRMRLSKATILYATLCLQAIFSREYLGGEISIPTSAYLSSNAFTSAATVRFHLAVKMSFDAIALLHRTGLLQNLSRGGTEPDNVKENPYKSLSKSALRAQNPYRHRMSLLRSL